MPRQSLLLTSLFTLLPAVLAAQAASLKLPENLEADGLPPIPVSVAAAADRYTEARSASFVDWHPSSQEILIATRFANTAQLHQVKSPLGARRQLTFFDEPVGNGVYDPVKGDFIIFARDSGGNEFGQLYRLDLATRNVTMLSTGGRTQNGSVRFTNKGDRFGFTSTRRNGADRDLQITSSQQQQGIAPPLTAIDRELRLIAKRDNLDGLEVRRLMLYAALQKAAGGAWKWIQ